MTLPFPQTTCPRRTGQNRFAIVIPVYNHHATIAQVVRRACRQGLPVIVVDDGSTDATYDKIKAMHNIRIIQHPENLGKGAALITGMRAAARVADWAICLDADGQHDPDEMGRLKEAITKGSRPIVIGKRKGMAAAPWTSRYGRGFSNFWVWISSGVMLSDSQSGYRIYPVPEILGLKVKARRYQYEIEVLAKAAWQAMPIIEVPVEVSYQPGGPRISHFHPRRDFVRNSRTFSRLIVQRIFTPDLWRVGPQGK